MADAVVLLLTGFLLLPPLTYSPPASSSSFLASLNLPLVFSTLLALVPMLSTNLLIRRTGGSRYWLPASAALLVVIDWLNG